MPKTDTHRGFTLIEVLVVIAIIAILAAILFPVLSTAQANGRKTSCMSNIHDIQVAVKLYKLDHNRYPPTLLGYVETGDKSIATFPYFDGNGQPLTLDEAANKPLFGGRLLKDTSKFFCPDNVPVKDRRAFTTAVYPTLPGVTLTGTVPNAIRRTLPAYFYAINSYDVGPQVDLQGNVVRSNGNPVMETHYSLSWTSSTGAGDSLNQLKYPNPPEDRTVVTWCTYHVATSKNQQIPVVMLSGTVKSVPLREFLQKGPLGLVP